VELNMKNLSVAALAYWEELYARLAANGEARNELGSAIDRTRARLAIVQ
jgi:hypothetical protein